MAGIKICFLLLALLFAPAMGASAHGKHVLLQVDPEPLNLFVSTTGSSTGNGTQDNPFGSITAAQQHIRALPSRPDGGIIVHIEGGEYHEALAFTAQDSGTATSPIKYSGSASGTVVSAGVRVPPSLWKPTTLPHTSATVYAAELTAINITDYGKMINGGLGDCQHNKLELFYNQQPQLLARWPNLFPNGSWAFINITAAKTNMEVTMKVEGDRPARWREEADPWLHGYFAWDWDDVFVPVLNISINGTNGTLQTNVDIEAQPGNHFFAINMLTELDSPGEYYVTSTGTLYFITPDGQPPADSAVVSVLPHSLTADHLSYVTFEGLNFWYARLDGAVTSGNNLLLNNCDFSLNGGGGLVFSGTNTLISNNVVRDVGCVGITVSGGDPKLLISGNNTVTRNNIHHYARWKRTYQAGINWPSNVGLLVSYNNISHAPHNGILGGGNEGQGNNCVFEFNIIDSVCQEVADSGAFYTCGQSGQAWISWGNIIRFNTFIRIHNWDDQGRGGDTGVQAIYLDDQITGYEVYKNTFINVSTAIFVGGGRNNSVFYNYIVDSDLAFHFDNRGMTWQSGDDSIDPPGRNYQGVLNMNPTQPPWSTAFPGFDNITHHGVPVGNSFFDNIYCRVRRMSDVNNTVVENWFSKMYNNVEACMEAGVVN